MKGRTPTADERRFMNRMGTLPCIACLLNGKKSTEISLHHIEGRVKPGAHFQILPLCVFHHQHAASLSCRKQYPWLVPIHACGTVGGRSEFEKYNNTEAFLLDLCLILLDKVDAGLNIN